MRNYEAVFFDWVTHTDKKTRKSFTRYEIVGTVTFSREEDCPIGPLAMAFRRASGKCQNAVWCRINEVA